MHVIITRKHQQSLKCTLLYEPSQYEVHLLCNLTVKKINSWSPLEVKWLLERQRGAQMEWGIFRMGKLLCDTITMDMHHPKCLRVKVNPSGNERY